MEKSRPIILLMLIILGCSSNTGSSADNFYRKDDYSNNKDDNPYQYISQIPLPPGYKRVKTDTGSFCSFLRNTRLKKSRIVYLYNGQPKYNQSAQYAVLDISVGNKDLQQCADAVMRLRAEYLFAEKLFEQIVFYDNNQTAYKFTAPYTKDNFMNYLNRVFGMCGSESLSKQLKPVISFATIQPGDVIIRGGFPGHAVIVMDVAADSLGNKIYMLAQSYMPAQDIHVLKNPGNEILSPWYEVNTDDIIQTPEYSFIKNELKRW